MRTLTYLVAASLDGRIAGPGHEIDAFDFPADLASHLIEHYPETLPGPARQAMGIDDRPNARFDTVVMGRETWELGRRDGLTSPYPHLRQIVVSRSLAADVDPALEVVPRLTAANFDEVVGSEGGGIWLCGGGVLAAALVDRIDELVVKRQPVVLGAGRPLIEGSYHPRRFELVERIEAGPVQIETFRRAG